LTVTLWGFNTNCSEILILLSVTQIEEKRKMWVILSALNVSLWSTSYTQSDLRSILAAQDFQYFPKTFSIQFHLLKILTQFYIYNDHYGRLSFQSIPNPL